MSKEIHRALGRIEGRLKGIRAEQKRQCGAIGSIDDRLGTVEKQSAKYGGAAGGLAGIVFAVGTEFIKKKLGM